MSNVTRTPPKVVTCPTIVVDTSTLGSNTVIAAQTGRSIRVLSMVVVAAAANTIKLMSAANKWYVKVVGSATGTEATPFSAAV